MTVPSSASRNDYVGDGATTIFPYTFKVFAAGDLVVTSTDPDGIPTTLVLGVDYTVSGAGLPGGGNVTLTTPLPGTGDPEDSHALAIERSIAATQDTDLRNQGPYLAEVIERALDRIVMMVQQALSWGSSALRLPRGEAPSDATTRLPPLEQRKGRILGFDATGAPGAYAQLEGETVSAAMTPVVQAATLENARDLLMPDGTVDGDKLEDGTVSNAKMSDMPPLTVKGNATGGAAQPDDLTAEETTELLGMQHIIQSRNVASPNATVPVHALTATGTESNIDLALVAKGTGAIVAQVPGLTAGNKRGARAVDLQKIRSYATQVAAGEESLLVACNECQASGDRTAAIASDHATVGGFNSLAVASTQATVLHEYCVVHGLAPDTKQPGSRVHGYAASRQGEETTASAVTTDATVTSLLYGSLLNTIPMDDEEAVMVTAQVVGYQVGGTNNAAGYVAEFTAKRAAGVATVALVGSAVVRAQENNAAWDCTITADATNGGVNIRVTGAAGVTVQWFAWIRIARVARA